MTTKIETAGQMRVVARMQTISRAAAGTSVVVGGIVLMASFDIGFLKSLSPNLTSMKTNTALSMLLGGASLWFLSDVTRAKWKSRLGYGCAILMSLIGVLTLLEMTFHWSLGIDQFLFKDATLSIGASWPNRMGINTAVCVSLIGISLLLLEKRIGRQRPSQIIATVSGVVSLCAVVGYVFDVQALYSIAVFTGMAIHTAATILILSTGLLLVRCQDGFMNVISRDSPSGALVRKLLPVALVLPTIAGWVRWEGQEYGLFGTAVGIILFATFNTLSLISFIYVGVVFLDQQLERISASEERFKSMVESAPDAMVIANGDGEIVLVNSQTEEMFGYERSELLKQKVEMLLPEKFRGKHSGHRRGFFRDPKVRTMGAGLELAALRKDGTEFPVEISLSPMKTRGEIWVSSAIRDVTARKRTEEEFRRTDEKLRLLVSGVKDYAILMLDPEGLVTTWSDGAERIKGYRAEEIIGQHFSKFYTPEDVADEKPSRELKVATKQGRYEEEGWRVRKDGSLFWASVVITALLDKTGQLRGFGKVTRDITERKRLAEALKASEERLQTAVEAAQLGVWDLDLLSDRAYRSLRHDQIFGYETLQPEWGAEIAASHVIPEDREIFRSSFAEAFKTNGFSLECRIRRAGDNSLRWIFAQGRVHRDREGKPARMMGVVADVTERKTAQEELERHQSELLKSNAGLVALNSELESFSYSVSHDLRAPLRTIDGFSHALLEDCADRLDEEGKKNLNRIRAAAQRMGLLIDDLLNLSRLSRTEMHVRTVDISALAESIASDLRKANPGREIDIRIEAGLKATADPGLLRAAMENLLSNAWKFTSKRASAHIEFGTSPGNGTPVYFVRDDGAGFDPKYADRLFGAFQRLHAMTEFAGTGVGLATVQRIVHRHGGRIWAESAVDRGATFYFTLSRSVS